MIQSQPQSCPSSPAPQPPAVPDLPSEILLLIMQLLSKTRKFATLRELVLANKACFALGSLVLARVPRVDAWIPIIVVQPNQMNTVRLGIDTGDRIGAVYRSRERAVDYLAVDGDLEELEHLKDEDQEVLGELLKEGPVLVHGGLWCLPARAWKLGNQCVVGELVPENRVRIRFRVAENRHGKMCFTFCGIFATDEEAIAGFREPEGADCSCGQECFDGPAEYQVRMLVVGD